MIRRPLGLGQIMQNRESVSKEKADHSQQMPRNWRTIADSVISGLPPC
jgi:hypothetical protein